MNDPVTRGVRRLARSYADPDRHAVHQLVVDAHVGRHPSTCNGRDVRQLALCLMTLDLFLERGHDVSRGLALHEHIVADLPMLPDLGPPVPVTGVTVSDVVPARTVEEHEVLVWTWARTVWDAWQAHHETVREWKTHSLGLEIVWQHDRRRPATEAPSQDVALVGH